MSDHSDILCMKFDMNTIQHLGVKLYSKLPPVLGELVANSYDADANNVTILLNDEDENPKGIIIKDDGNGLDFEEINSKFLMIGRNRRTSGHGQTPSGRKVIGKKGIGKLSIFGIADDIIITTIKEKIKNKFKMSLPKILSSENEYHPEHIVKNQKSEENNGTIIELSGFKRKSGFDPEKIAEDLAKRFLIFDENFRVSIIYNNGEPIEVTSDLRFANIEKEFEWSFPEKAPESEYSHKSKVKGKIFTAKTPVPPGMKGIYLVARGKLVHKNDFFGISANDYAHAYLTGYLIVDFIDVDDEDLISTNRESLNWEHEETEALQEYLQKIISFITGDWRKKRREKKEKKIKEKTSIDVPGWISSLPAQDRSLAKKMTDLVLNNDNIDEDKSADMVSYIKESFEFGSFKEFAAKLDELGDISEADFVKLFQDWELIESREMYKLALVRVEAISKFKKYIETDVKEVPTMRDFLHKFPWLLDNRIYDLKIEQTYTKILKDKFKEDKIEKEDKRVDFFCIDLMGYLFIIEIKRPSHKLNTNDLQQAAKYGGFLKRQIGNEFRRRAIVILVGGGMVKTDDFNEIAEALRAKDTVHIKTYNELLSTAEKNNKEFIEKYEELKKIKEKN